VHVPVGGEFMVKLLLQLNSPHLLPTGQPLETSHLAPPTGE
jgi:hypothetical protein